MGRTNLCAVLLALGSCLTTTEIIVAAPPQEPAKSKLTEEARGALEAGLQWLSKHQQLDGSWLADVGYKLDPVYVVTAANKPHVGITALAGMALLNAEGERDPEANRKRVAAAAKFILSCQGPDGLITRGGTRMYSHAFATWFLGEYCLKTGDEAVRSRLRRAVSFTCKSQSASGGWGYAPFTVEVDLSVTACQFMALQAARHGGARVPRQTVERAVDYIVNSANTIGSDAGSFKYEYRAESPRRTRTSFALTAAGLAVLRNAGLCTDSDIAGYVKRRGLTRFEGARPPLRTAQILEYLGKSYHWPQRSHYRYYYGSLFAVGALRDADEKTWEKFFSRMQRELVDDQSPGGSWPMSKGMIGPAYSTASACLILQAYCVPAAPLRIAPGSEK